MENINFNGRNYAHLPDELLAKILEKVPSTAEKMSNMFDAEDRSIQQGIKILREKNYISKLTTSTFSGSLIAVDGSWILEKMTGSDLLLALAVGVEGLTTDDQAVWGHNKNQYYQWQTALSHNEANGRLGQGVMFLMELSILANANHEIRIMDGTHFTSILKINSMLSAKEENAGTEYAQALRDFLKETYDKIIPDIPDIIETAFNDDKIIALAKYTSSRDVISTFLTDSNIKIDDRIFFTFGLQEDEYLTPIPVGQSSEERDKIWNDLHIICNLDIPEKKYLNEKLKHAISSITTKEKQSNLFFTYYKPYQDGLAYRIELKKSLAEDKCRFEKYLLSLKKQIVFPEIKEPFPQYLADRMAKSISGGMLAIKEAICLCQNLKIDNGKFNLLLNYRT